MRWLLRGGCNCGVCFCFDLVKPPAAEAFGRHDRNLERNPVIKAGELKRDLEEFKKRKTQGELCDCGNPIWIIGSAITGKVPNYHFRVYFDNSMR